MSDKWWISCLVMACSYVVGNPFLIHPKDYSYESVQEELKRIDIPRIVNQYYREGLMPVEGFYGRIGTGIRGNLIQEGMKTEAVLEKIGEGGPDCVVTYATINGRYPLFVRSLVKGLKKSGFNGYVWYRIGGYPNPTGKEIQYAGVPYAFKVWIMLEAHQMGFDRVLWLDSAMIPLQGVSLFFDYMEEFGGYFWGLPMPASNESLILPIARQSIMDALGVDPMKATTLMGAIFGWKFNTPLSDRFLEYFYKMVEVGYPFFSAMPEEFVIGSIISLPEFQSWSPSSRFLDGTPLRPTENGPDSLEEIALSKELLYPFHHRGARNVIEGWD